MKNSRIYFKKVESKKMALIGGHLKNGSIVFYSFDPVNLFS